ncbi:DNA breaking-rejoining protein [Escherichia coli]|uniref:DNA breaking-rejoining protein n=3 Tax=Escherichia coli TaxID=562 RepID=UPI00324A8430
MSDPFSRLAARMDAITVRKMGKTASINDVDMTVIPGETLAELNALSGPAVSLVVFSVTNGAIVIHTQRLKSDPGGNLLS